MIFSVTGQRMTLQQSSETVSPSAFCNAQFSFDASWRYLSVWANLEGCGICYRMKVENGMITQDCCAHLSEGRWEVYLKGERYNENGELLEERITNLCSFAVAGTTEQPAYLYRTISTPTPLEQIKNFAHKASDLAKKVLYMAEAGDFQGPAGPAGSTTSESITSALGYTPADAERVSQLELSKVHTSTYTAGMATKQDIIPDLSGIRSGAALGATALQSHQDISAKEDKGLLTINGNEKNVSSADLVITNDGKTTSYEVVIVS